MERLLKYFNRNYFDLLWVMTEKELKARYKNTIFGFLWIIINPLLQMAVIGFVFGFFLKEPIDNYFLYLLVGLLVWNYFSISFQKATSSLVNERNLIKKAKFPREIIPISIILSNFINFVISILLISIPAILLNLLRVQNIPIMILGSVFLLSFTIGISLLTSALNVRYRDISFMVQALLIIWFYATPIVYSVNFIPYNLMWFWRLNPLVAVVQLFQHSIALGSMPGLGMFIANTLINITVLIFGIYVFAKECKDFDDWL